VDDQRAQGQARRCVLEKEWLGDVGIFYFVIFFWFLMQLISSRKSLRRTVVYAPAHMHTQADHIFYTRLGRYARAQTTNARAHTLTHTHTHKRLSATRRLAWKFETQRSSRKLFPNFTTEKKTWADVMRLCVYIQLHTYNYNTITIYTINNYIFKL